MAARRQALRLAARALEQRLNADLSVLGSLLLERAYYHCAQCQSGFCPRDGVLRRSLTREATVPSCVIQAQSLIQPPSKALLPRIPTPTARVSPSASYAKPRFPESCRCVMLGNGPAWNNARELFPQAIQILDRCRSIDFRRDQRKQAMGRQRVAPNSTTANCILTRKAFALLQAFSRRGCRPALLQAQGTFRGFLGASSRSRRRLFIAPEVLPVSSWSARAGWSAVVRLALVPGARLGARPFASPHRQVR